MRVNISKCRFAQEGSMNELCLKGNAYKYAFSVDPKAKPWRLGQSGQYHINAKICGSILMLVGYNHTMEFMFPTYQWGRWA